MATVFVVHDQWGWLLRRVYGVCGVCRVSVSCMRCAHVVSVLCMCGVLCSLMMRKTFDGQRCTNSAILERDGIGGLLMHGNFTSI